MSAAAKPRGNPILERLKGKGRIQQFSGYVGSGAEGRIEVYSDLSMGTCLEIGSEDVLHIEDGEKPTQPSVLFVREDAAISVRYTTTAKALAEMGDEECNCSSTTADEDQGYLAAMVSSGGLGASSGACRRNKRCKDKCMKKDPFIRQGCMDSCDVYHRCPTGFGGNGGLVIL